MQERGQTDSAVFVEHVGRVDELEVAVVAAFDAHQAALNAYAYAAVHDREAAGASGGRSATSRLPSARL